VLVGNPEHPRVTSFQRALSSRGHPEARLVSWLSLARRESVLSEIEGDEGVLRLESPGQSPAVTRQLLRLGEAEARGEGVMLLPREALRQLRPRTGRILAPRQRHLGFRRVLASLERWLETRPGWRAWPSPADVARLFDKRWTSRAYLQSGVPVPSPVDGVATVEDLHRQMPLGASWYVKLASGSSAACIALVTRSEAGLEAITTVLHAGGDELYNTRRLRTLQGERAERVLAFLLGEGAQIELSIEKARLDGQPFDLRVLVIGDEPAFVVPRSSRGGPFTNLHLGGARAELDRVRALLGERAWDEAMDAALRVGRLHEVLHLGVDVVVESGTGSPYVVEANAFGDWLLGLPTHEREVMELEARSAGRAAGTRPGR
jgi:hypothetical protein